MSKQKFQPTTEMLKAVELLLTAMAMEKTIRPIVEQYQREILTAGQWRIRAEFQRRIGDEIILDPKKTFLMDESDFAIYWERCKAARQRHGLLVEQDEFCPLLVAENDVRRCRQHLADLMEPITSVTFNRLVSQQNGLNHLERYVALTLKLLVPFLNRSGKDILAS